MPIEPHHCKNIRRKFGYVELAGTLQGDYGSQTWEILKNIGENNIKVEMNHSQKKSGVVRKFGLHVDDADFLNLMRFMPNLRELSTNRWKILGSSVRAADVDFQLTRLKNFTCYINMQNLNALIPPSLSTLLLTCRSYISEGSSNLEILARQQRLVNLSLIFMKIDMFNYQPSNCRIKELIIQDLVFPIKSEFEKFSDFMKIQKSVEVLSFTICKDDWKNNNDYTEILAHLLSLKTVKELGIECGNLMFTPASKISIFNPTVETLTIMNPPNETDLQKLSNFFPNVTNLQIYWDYYSINNLSINLRPIRSMQKIRKFEISYMTEEMFAQLELKQMQEFYLTCYGTDPFPSYTDTVSVNDNFEEVLPNEILESRSASWRAFVNNNCQLKVLDLLDISFPMELLQITLENLPLLKSLRVRVAGYNYSFAKYQPEFDYEEYKEAYGKEQAEKTAKSIGENYDRFEHLILKLEDDGEHVVEHLKKYYPKVKTEKRTYDEMQSDGLLQITQITEEPLKVVILLCHNE
jgi:hypothetical protein